MFTAWWVSEASWRHNRLHLVVAVLSVICAVGLPTLGTMVIAVVLAGSLLARIAYWYRARTGARLALHWVDRDQ